MALARAAASTLDLGRRDGQRVLIIGAGIGGLSFAHYLRKFAVIYEKLNRIASITVLESGDSVGGCIKTKRFTTDECYHELGPRWIRRMNAFGNNTVCLLDEIGLGNAIDKIKVTGPQKRYLYHKGVLDTVPDSPASIFSRIPHSDVLFGKALFRDLFVAKKMDLSQYPHSDPSVHDFVKHHFGPEMADNVCDPVLRGITSGDCRKTSMRALAPSVLEGEQHYGKVLKSIYKPAITKPELDEVLERELESSKLVEELSRERVTLFGVANGLQTLPEQLCGTLLDTEVNSDQLTSVYTQSPVTKLQYNSTSLSEAPFNAEVLTVDGELLDLPVDHVVAALPAPQLAKIISLPTETGQSPAAKEIGQAFDQALDVSHAPIATVAVEYRGLPPNDFIRKNFGVLTNSQSDSKALGITFDTGVMPGHDDLIDATRLTCMMGGAWFEQVFGTSNPHDIGNDTLESTALKEIARILKLKKEPFRMTPCLWHTGIAQYKPGHVATTAESRAQLERLKVPISLVGQSYDGVAINDVIMSARRAALKFIKTL